jgi:trigger factor
VKTEIKEISACVREITLTVEAARAEADFRAVLREFAKYATVPGFRPGKAPMNMVERIYGARAKDEFVDRKLQDYYIEAIDSENQHPITEGHPVTREWEIGQDLTAVFRYEVKPEVVVTKYRELEIPFKKTEVTEDIITHEMEHIREHSGTMEPSEAPIENDDVATVEIMIPTKVENEFVPLPREIVVGADVYAAELHEAMRGQTAGFEFESPLITRVGEEDSPFKKPLKMKILSVKRNNKPNLDDEFAKDLGYDSLAVMREKVAEEIRKEYERQNRQGLKEAIVNKLIEENPVEVPPSAVQRYAEEMAKAYAKENGGKVENLLPIYKIFAERDFKKYYIVEKLKELDPVELTDNDRETMIAELAANVGVTPEEYRDRYSAQIESEDFTDAVIEKIVFDRIEASSTLVDPPQPAEQPENAEE